MWLKVQFIPLTARRVWFHKSPFPCPRSELKFQSEPHPVSQLSKHSHNVQTQLQYGCHQRYLYVVNANRLGLILHTPRGRSQASDPPSSPLLALDEPDSEQEMADADAVSVLTLKMVQKQKIDVVVIAIYTNFESLGRFLIAPFQIVLMPHFIVLVSPDTPAHHREYSVEFQTGSREAGRMGVPRGYDAALVRTSSIRKATVG